MRIKTIIRKGSEHKGVDNKGYCEDYLYSYEGERWLVAATFDGCSDGVDSHFASALSGKCLRAVIANLQEGLKKDSLTLENVFAYLVHDFLHSLENMRHLLKLPGNEMLSTVILLVYDKVSEDGKIIAMGDGIVKINGELYVIDQNNQPEYPIIYAGQVSKSYTDILEFLKTFKNTWTFHGLEDVTISTDGLLQWKNKSDETKSFEEAMDYLITDSEMSHLSVMLARKFNILKLKKWENKDDIGIIRILKDEEKNTETENVDNRAVHSESQ